MELLKKYWDKTFSRWEYRFVLHISFWLFFFSSWLDETMVVKIDSTQHYLVTLTGVLFVLYLYYPLVYFITPLFKNKKWFLGAFAFLSYYIIAISLRTYHIELIIQWHNFHRSSVQGGEFFQNIFERQLTRSKSLSLILSSLSSLIVIIYIPLSLKFLRYAYEFTQQQTWIVSENARLQLATLKSQINPHFFFNTLNNLQSFIVQNEKKKSVDLLNRLADFMRSSLYDGEKEYISVQKEIELIGNYVSIEKIRFEEDIDIKTVLTASDPNYLIPTFIFLPFIENAFKHGGKLPSNEVKIEIQLCSDKEKIELLTVNTFLTSIDDDYIGGIGLQNVRKRLDHYFNNRYQLAISTLENVFTVKLVIRK